MPNSPRRFLLASLLLAGLSFLSCAPRPPFPASAAANLDRAWAALPGSASYDLTILRAWPGKMPAGGDPIASAGPVEVWCIETAMSAKESGATPSETVIWISTRTGVDTDWITVPLMTMSSLWPYEACDAGL